MRLKFIKPPMNKVLLKRIAFAIACRELFFANKYASPLSAKSSILIKAKKAYTKKYGL